MKDRELFSLLEQEKKRQKKNINLIASENMVSPEVLKALASETTNKYAEGYPDARYYAGNTVVDQIEKLAISRALKLFKLNPKKWGVNVQPHSGSPANLAVYHALVPQGGKIMSMKLSHGGHLTHGHGVSFSGTFWKHIPYMVDEETERIDYGELLRIAKKEKPQILIAGFSAYSRKIDFKKMRAVADATGAYLMVDMAHIAGLVAAGHHPSPFPYADIVTTTTHKTLRGPRGGMIFAKTELMSKINKSVFPGMQGGPHMNQIAALCVALAEASAPSFKTYIASVIKNTQILAQVLKKKGWRIISGGTDNHLFLVDVWKGGKGLSGKEATQALEKEGVIVNMNTLPFDTRSPMNPSGIRIGAAFETTKGKTENDMYILGEHIHDILTRALDTL
jgi:glycine hydroxymethyltransferase